MFLFKPEIVKELILGEAKEKAVLFGLLNKSNAGKTYFQEEVGKYHFLIEKIMIPNCYARLDAFYINKNPVGTIVSLEITGGLYHMVGMFVAEPYRANLINKTLPGYDEAVLTAGYSKITPATFFLEKYLNDVVISNGYQITLEVTNNNEPAWYLYEKPLLIEPGANLGRGFELLSKQEIEMYARVRRKKIGKWHEVFTGEGQKGYGVQWSHIPDYGGRPERWSTNRVYLIKPNQQDPFLLNNKSSYFTNKLRAIISVLRYGNIMAYIVDKAKSKVKVKK